MAAPLRCAPLIPAIGQIPVERNHEATPSFRDDAKRHLFPLPRVCEGLADGGDIDDLLSAESLGATREAWEEQEAMFFLNFF